MARRVTPFFRSFGTYSFWYAFLNLFLLLLLLLLLFSSFFCSDFTFFHCVDILGSKRRKHNRYLCAITWQSRPVNVLLNFIVITVTCILIRIHTIYLQIKSNVYGFLLKVMLNLLFFFFFVSSLST